MELQHQITTILIGVNILLLVGIIITNIRSYKKIKAEYTVFSMVFAGLFLVQNVVSGYFIFSNMEFYVPEVTNHILALTGLQTIAFSVLLWMERQ